MNEKTAALRVLVVDDSQEMRVIYSCLLETLQGVSPAESNDIPDALEKISNSHKEGLPFKLILLDIRLPGINGIDGAKLFRDAGYTGIIVACTAVASATGRRESLDAGIDVYLDNRHLKRETLQAILEQAMLR